MSAFLLDVRYAIRLLGKRPGVAALAILTLALGIGANTAIFSIVEAVLISPLPYADPDALVRIRGLNTRDHARTPANLSVPDFADFERLSRSFDSLGAHNYGGFSTITGGGLPERVRRMLVSSGYFRVLRAAPALGRTFSAEDDRPAPPNLVVLRHGFWQRRFGGRADAVGSTLEIGGTAFTVIGVLDRGFTHPGIAAPEQPEFFMLLDRDENQSSRGGRYVHGIGRLGNGVTIEQARQELEAIAARLAEQYPRSNTDRSVTVAALSESIVGGTRRALIVLLAAVACVLLIACVNLAHLFLAEALARRREMSIRAALGASGRRLLAQLLTETALLAVAGGAFGLLLAWGALRVLLRLAGPALPRAGEVAIDGTVLAFTTAISVFTVVAIGLGPALAAMRVNPTSGLKDGGRTATPAAARGRNALVTAEVALTVMLLVAAGLLVRSLWHLLNVNPGFASTGVLIANVPVPLERYPEGTQIDVFARLYERLQRLPGVDAVGAVNILPLSGNYSCDGVQIEGRPVPEGQGPCAEARSVNVDYFTALAIPLVRGRLFDARDTSGSPRVVVVNEAMAERFWPGEDPVGKRMIYVSRGQGDAREVVGVVGNVRHFGLEAPAPPEFYTPQTQPPSYHTMTLAIRAAGALDAGSLAAAVRGELAAIDPEIPLYGVSTLDTLVAASVSQPRFRTLVLALFAGVALLLALVGVYGVASRTTAQRTQEIGVRVALGARPGDIVRMVMGQALAPVGAGVLAGLAGSMAVSRALTSLLFDVKTTDALAYALAPAALLAAAALATALPARRAAKTDPLAALRAE